MYMMLVKTHLNTSSPSTVEYTRFLKYTTSKPDVFQPNFVAPNLLTNESAFQETFPYHYHFPPLPRKQAQQENYDESKY